MSSFAQYLRDTKAELRHVAWPTREQTIVYTMLVILISIAVSLYVGFFDFLFTRGLEALLTGEVSTPSGLEVTQQPAAPSFEVGGVSTSTTQ